MGKLKKMEANVCGLGQRVDAGRHQGRSVPSVFRDHLLLTGKALCSLQQDRIRGWQRLRAATLGNRFHTCVVDVPIVLPWASLSWLFLLLRVNSRFLPSFSSCLPGQSPCDRNVFLPPGLCQHQQFASKSLLVPLANFEFFIYSLFIYSFVLF